MNKISLRIAFLVLGFICVALLVHGVGLQLPRVLKMLTGVSGAVSSSPSPSSDGSQAASAVATTSSAFVTDKVCTGLSSIESSFNSTAIAEGNFIWFNSAIHVDGAGSDAATIFLNDSAITFAANGTNYSLAVPAATISFDPAATAASTSFDAASNRWATIVPGGFSGRAFLSGLAFPVPAGGLPGGISSVTWSAAISTDKPGVTAQWGWGAAVYSIFGTDYNALAVNPVGEGQPSQGARLLSKGESNQSGVGRTDSVGKPASLEAFLTGGAGGDGGSDFTGSFGVMRGVMSAVTPCVAGASSSSRASITLAGNAGTERVAGTERILQPHGIGATKSCAPSTASGGAAIQCSYTIQNLTPDDPVTGLTVTNTIPDPIAPPSECTGTVPSVDPNVPCFLLDPVTGLPTATQVTTLAPMGTIDPGTGIHLDTCGGIIDEAAPSCETSDCHFTDRVFGTGVVIGASASASSGGVVQVLACTPTPTVTGTPPTSTPTNTPTNTPTPTPRIARPPCPNSPCEEHRPPLPPIPTRRPTP